MSGTTTQSGQTLSDLDTATTAAPEDTVLAIVDGALQQLPVSAVTADSLPLAGGNITGPVTVSVAPTDDTGVVRKVDLTKYVSDSVSSSALGTITATVQNNADIVAVIASTLSPVQKSISASNSLSLSFLSKISTAYSISLSGNCTININSGAGIGGLLTMIVTLIPNGFNASITFDGKSSWLGGFEPIFSNSQTSIFMLTTSDDGATCYGKPY